MRLHKVVLMGIAAVTAVSAVGCSSSSSSGSSAVTTSSASTSGTTTAAAVSGPPSSSAAPAGSAASSGGAGGSSAAGVTTPGTGDIVLGNISSCSGPLGSQSAACPAIKAWAQSVNDAGGINGHQVKMIVMDDQGNPATALKQAKELIESDKVQAIVGEESIVDSTWADYVSKSGVPVVGGIPISSQFMQNPDFFANGSSVITAIYGSLSLGAKAGKKNYGYMYCAESTVCEQSVPLMAGITQLLGMKMVYSAKISATAASYTAQCLAAKQAGVDVMEIGDGSPVVLRVIAACEQQGLKVLNVTNDGTLSQAWLGAPGTEGTLAAEVNFPFNDSSTPATQAFQAAMTKYAPDLSANKQIGPNAAYAWTSGKLYEAAAKAGKLGPASTSDDVKSGLYALKNETLGGLVPPLNFTKGKPSFISCYFTMGITDGKFTAPNGLTPQCIPDAQLQPLLKAIGG